MPFLQVNSRSIDQKSGEICTVQADLQPISFKSDRLLGHRWDIRQHSKEANIWNVGFKNSRLHLCRVMCFFLQSGNDQAIQTHAAPCCFERNLTVQITANPHIE